MNRAETLAASALGAVILLALGLAMPDRFAGGAVICLAVVVLVSGVLFIAYAPRFHGGNVGRPFRCRRWWAQREVVT